MHKQLIMAAGELSKLLFLFFTFKNTGLLQRPFERLWFLTLVLTIQKNAVAQNSLPVALRLDHELVTAERE